MRKLFVVEFYGSFTNGTMVLFCEPEEVAGLIKSGTGVDLITDAEQVRRFRLWHMDFTPYITKKQISTVNSVTGFPIRMFNRAVRERFNQSIADLGFAKRVIKLASNPERHAGPKRVRLDWLVYWDLPITEGAYIVLDGVDLFKSGGLGYVPRVISNTYDVN